MSGRQREALALLRRARAEQPSTDDGLVLAQGEETFYDVEVKVAYVNWQTAQALARRGLVTLGPYDPDHGTTITLSPGETE